VNASAGAVVVRRRRRAGIPPAVDSEMPSWGR
jgi:hypothetical protein